MIAPAAEARLMARLVTPADEIIRILQRWAEGRATLEQGVTVPPVRLNVIEGFPTSVAAFATDLPSLTNWGTPYLFGPGSVHVAHTDDEQVRIAELWARMNERAGMGPPTRRRAFYCRCAKTTKCPPGSRTPISSVP